MPLLKDFLLLEKEQNEECPLYRDHDTFVRQPFLAYTTRPRFDHTLGRVVAPSLGEIAPAAKLLNYLYRLVLQQDFLDILGKDERYDHVMLSIGGEKISLKKVAKCFSRLNSFYQGQMGRAIRSEFAVKFLETRDCPTVIEAHSE